MKLSGLRLVAVATLLGAALTTVNASADNATTVFAATVGVPAPPALRVEVVGVAPSPHHVWIPGFWRWNVVSAAYSWQPGYWQDEAVVAPYGPPALLYEDLGASPGVDYVMVPGYWRWYGGRYHWAHGHWSLHRDAYLYYHHDWDRVNGHWQHRMERWGHYGEGTHAVPVTRGHDAWRGRAALDRRAPAHGTVLHRSGAWHPNHVAAVHRATGLRAGGHHAPTTAARGGASQVHQVRR